jgi:hypothetical protein
MPPTMLEFTADEWVVEPGRGNIALCTIPTGQDQNPDIQFKNVKINGKEYYVVEIVYHLKDRHTVVGANGIAILIRGDV